MSFYHYTGVIISSNEWNNVIFLVKYIDRLTYNGEIVVFKEINILKKHWKFKNRILHITEYAYKLWFRYRLYEINKIW